LHSSQYLQVRKKGIGDLHARKRGIGMLVLGLSGSFSREDVDLTPNVTDGLFHDAAACLIKDGALLAAIEEERFNRIKKTSKFPVNAIRACLDIADVKPSEIYAVGHYFQEGPIDELLNEHYIRNNDLPLRYSRELITDHLRSEFDLDMPGDRLLYAEHHVTHALSCFVRSGMKEALVVVMDGRGERHSTTIYRGVGGRLESLATYGIGKSLGHFYAQAIRLLGYGLGDEYKIMGLAPYGNTGKYRDRFDSLYLLEDRGDYRLRPVTTAFPSTLFPPRRKGAEFTQQHMDFAAGVQQTLETIAMHVIGYWAKHTGLPNLCFVGGVAHNSTLNGRILQSGKFREVFIHPASHDGGSAEGAALAAASRLGAPPPRQPRMRSASVGPGLGTTAEIEKELAAWGELIGYERPADIVECAARLLAEDAVLGWAYGPSEYGPRALGNRSILADARPSGNKQRINSMVKKREGYRPFAPVVTAAAAADYFDLPETAANYDFMSFVVNVHEGRKAELGAVTHVDGTARVQIIDPISNERFHRLVQKFGELTGTPVLLNTSFNNNAEPIIQSAQDALTCFLTTELDFLVIEDFLVRRRPDRLFAFDNMVLEFRPVTRLVKRSRLTLAGAPEVTYEIYLDHPKGSRAEISPATYAVLEAVDGLRTVESLAEAAGGLTSEIRRELYALWQQRFFALRPRVTVRPM
jgi:predicted NodU family carbamoyl transferase